MGGTLDRSGEHVRLHISAHVSVRMFDPILSVSVFVNTCLDLPPWSPFIHELDQDQHQYLAIFAAFAV